MELILVGVAKHVTDYSLAEPAAGVEVELAVLGPGAGVPWGDVGNHQYLGGGGGGGHSMLHIEFLS